MRFARLAPVASLALALAACAVPEGALSDETPEGTIANGAAALSVSEPLPCTSIDTMEIQSGPTRTVGDKQVVDIKMTLNHSRKQRFSLCAGNYPSALAGDRPIGDVGVRVEGESKAAHAAIDHVNVRLPSLAIDYAPKPDFTGVDTFRVVVDKTEFHFELTVRPFMLQALGDSVTAGFGYLSDGTSMTPDAWGIRGEDRFDPIVLEDCRPLAHVNDRCSSNSVDRHGYAVNAVHWSADYGLGNGVSWAAQLAKASGVTSARTKVGGVEYPTFANYAVTGASPYDYLNGSEWGPKALSQIVTDGPDVVVMTLGANPLLSQLLLEHAFECEAAAKKGNLDACVRKYADAELLDKRMEWVLRTLRNGTVKSQTQIMVMLYPTVWPTVSVYSPDMIRRMGDLINGTLREVAERVDADRDAGDISRIQVVEPPAFHFGAVMGGNGGRCDGASKQSRVTQDAFGVLDKVVNGQFVKCPSDDHWVISGDTGVHPSKVGHTQMARSALEALREAGLQLPCEAGDSCRL